MRTNDDAVNYGLNLLFAAVEKKTHSLMRFSRKTDHAVDRFSDREIDPYEALSELSKCLHSKICEILFFCYLQNKPLRMDIKTEKFVFGFTCAVHDGLPVLRFRTIINNFPGRKDSRISTFIIEV